jgi:hypothetical protein
VNYVQALKRRMGRVLGRGEAAKFPGWDIQLGHRRLDDWLAENGHADCFAAWEAGCRGPWLVDFALAAWLRRKGEPNPYRVVFCGKEPPPGELNLVLRAAMLGQLVSLSLDGTEHRSRHPGTPAPDGGAWDAIAEARRLPGRVQGSPPAEVPDDLLVRVGQLALDLYSAELIRALLDEQGRLGAGWQRDKIDDNLDRLTELHAAARADSTPEKEDLRDA